ncbi:hypothetical protein HY68_26835 [Streptomyces sp. AcH 505]|uniref:MarR family winged helix-turn-helix transcriptional regulator n=1 Tax=unclassified Streptomyces TaxID=2593676 RepID=UPI0005923BE8|nr:MarR family transcriptional regulator [Streptomyces sp. NBC_00370]KIF71383.1 hypothetical protein HY68_26835 [Streptomyces sp. AcH 505]
MEGHLPEERVPSGPGADDPGVSAETVADISVRAAVALDPQLLPHRLRVLYVVGERPRINLTRLAKAVDLGLPRASRLCGRLAAAGLLTRTAVARDRRGVEFTLTEEGAAELAGHLAGRAAELAAVMRLMSVEERRDLLAGLRSFVVSLDAVRGDRP